MMKTNPPFNFIGFSSSEKTRFFLYAGLESSFLKELSALVEKFEYDFLDAWNKTKSDENYRNFLHCQNAQISIRSRTNYTLDLTRLYEIHKTAIFGLADKYYMDTKHIALKSTYKEISDSMIRVRRINNHED